MNLFVRSALYGLSCFPQVAVAHTEAVAAISLVHSDLLRWRETLVEAALLRPSLTADAIQNILDTTDLSTHQHRDIQYDLRFPHQRAQLDPSEAMHRLAGLVDFLGREKNLEEEMAELNAAAMDDPMFENYDGIELRRQTLREQRVSMLDEAYMLGSREGDLL